MVEKEEKIDEGNCEICHNSPESCTCPECPVCGVAGDKTCVTHSSERITALNTELLSLKELLTKTGFTVLVREGKTFLYGHGVLSGARSMIDTEAIDTILVSSGFCKHKTDD